MNDRIQGDRAEAPGTQLPRYKCHKEVHAARITAFRQNGQPDMPDLVLGEIGAIVTLLPDWHAKHKPHVGGYYVVYDDGYKSFSPAAAFEGGYAAMHGAHPRAEATESEIAAVSTAPRVTKADLEANIASEHFFTGTEACMGADLMKQGHSPHGAAFSGAPLDLLTFCVLVLRNGFTVTGQSACASPENFDAEIGKRIAREDAVRQVWPLMGYLLKEQLFQATKAIAE